MSGCISITNVVRNSLGSSRGGDCIEPQRLSGEGSDNGSSPVQPYEKFPVSRLFRRPFEKIRSNRPDYGSANDFQRKASVALRKTATLYPGLTIGKAKGGFTIHATRLAVPLKAGAKVTG